MQPPKGPGPDDSAPRDAEPKNSGPNNPGQNETPAEDSALEKEGKKVLEELARLRVKLKNTTDRDIRAVLQMRIDQIEKELTPEQLKAEASRASLGIVGPIEEEEPDEPPAEPATPQQLQEADRLIGQARVEKMRGNAAKANELLQQAAKVAPGAPTVLESLGDSYMERKQIKAAIRTYRSALRLAPKNVGLEDKLAMAALGMASLGSFDDQMRMASIDSPFLTKGDAVARLPYAILLSAMIPGAGHMVLGQTAKGAAILATWVACLFWLFLKQKDVVEVTGMLMGKGTHGNLMVMAPVFIMFVTYLGCLASLKGMKDSASHNPIARPQPPVNLPFD